MDKRTSYTPIILAVVLLLLPVLYVGSYLALVVPDALPVEHVNLTDDGEMVFGMGVDNYRWGRGYSARLFWPLEQIDRKVRPGAWNDP